MAGAVRIVCAHPPMIEEIRARFKFPAGGAVIFAWGDTIYNPQGVDIPPQLIAHEDVHGRRQNGDPDHTGATVNVPVDEV